MRNFHFSLSAGSIIGCTLYGGNTLSVADDQRQLTQVTIGRCAIEIPPRTSAHRSDALAAQARYAFRFVELSASSPEVTVVCQIVLFVWSFLLDVFAISRLTGDEKDVEILLLRQQLRIVERHQVRGPTLPRWQKIPLVAFVMRLKTRGADWRDRFAASVCYSNRIPC